MPDLKNPRVIWMKGILFLLLGLFAVGMLLALAPDLKVAALLVIAIWAFCRAYYFAFYVIEHYVDANYQFAGLGDFLRYALSAKKQSDKSADDENSSR